MATVDISPEILDSPGAGPPEMGGIVPAGEKPLSEPEVIAGGLGEREPVNASLRNHMTGVTDWRHGELSRTLYMWAERLNKAFLLNLVTPAVRIGRGRIRTLGTYLSGRNDFGLLHVITLNTRHLGRSLAELLETLLHELLHEWQELHGKPGKNNYHNIEFREKARSLGLMIDRYGHSLGVAEGPFRALLKQCGVDTSSLSLPKELRHVCAFVGQSKLKKWSCGCTNVRAAVEVQAQCLKCGRRFVLAGPGRRIGTDPVEFKPDRAHGGTDSADGQASAVCT